MISQVPTLPEPATESLDLLNVVDLKHFSLFFIPFLTATLALEKESDENSPVRVRVDATTCVAFREGGEEEGCALRGFVVRRRPQVHALFRVGRGGLGSEGQDVNVFGFHEFFLDAGRRKVDEVIVADRGAAACAGYPT